MHIPEPSTNLTVEGLTSSTRVHSYLSYRFNDVGPCYCPGWKTQHQQEGISGWQFFNKVHLGHLKLSFTSISKSFFMMLCLLKRKSNRGIPLASFNICGCCPYGYNLKTINYVFHGSQMVAGVWEFFATTFGISFLTSFLLRKKFLFLGE